MNPEQLTRIRFGDDRTVLSGGAEPEVVLEVAAIRIATRLFRHDPPTPGEIEQAIDWIEDALATTGLKQAVRGDLVMDDPLLFEKLGIDAEDERIPRDQVEARFQRLASVSLGHPRAQADPPSDPLAAAVLVILRECLHHLGYSGLVPNRR